MLRGDTFVDNEEIDTREGHGLSHGTTLAQERVGINRLWINPRLK